MIAPGSDGEEIGYEFRRQARGKRLARDLGGPLLGQVLEHGERDQHGIARRPRSGRVAEHVKLDGQVGFLLRDGRVDAACILLEKMQLVLRQGGDGAVGGGAELQRALQLVVRELRGAEDFSQRAGGVAAQDVHLEQPVLRDDEALREDEVVGRGGSDGGDAACIALDRNGLGKAGDGERAIDLRQRLRYRRTHPVAGVEDSRSGCQDEQHDQSQRSPQPSAERSLPDRCRGHRRWWQRGCERCRIVHAARGEDGLVVPLRFRNIHVTGLSLNGCLWMPALQPSSSGSNTAPGL